MVANVLCPYYMATFIHRSAHKMTHADWLLNGLDSCGTAYSNKELRRHLRL